MSGAAPLVPEIEAMRNPDSYYLAPRSDEQDVMKMWMKPSRAANSSWSSAVLGTKKSHSPVVGRNLGESLGNSLRLARTSSFGTLDSDPFESRVSLSSGLSGLPEIPLIQSQPSPINREGSVSSTSEEDDSGTPYWSSIAHSNPIWDPPVATVGESLGSNTGHARGRSSSLSSTASRPAPAKSILSSSSSIKTYKGRSPPSVKFRDMPTIHYEEEEGECDELHEESSWPSSPVTSEPPSIGRRRRGFGWLSWLAQSMHAAQKKPKDSSPVEGRDQPVRPVISAPMPLWEAPRSYNTLPRRNTTSSSARSIRSVKSHASLRSVRSCASRLQVYWERLGGKDPFRS